MKFHNSRPRQKDSKGCVGECVWGVMEAAVGAGFLWMRTDRIVHPGLI
jgi:hypothetical protein